MKVELLITKNGASIYSGAHDISDAESFGKACADAWSKIRQDRLSHETSIGALFEHMDDNVLDQLSGAHITVWKV